MAAINYSVLLKDEIKLRFNVLSIRSLKDCRLITADYMLKGILMGFSKIRMDKIE
jgi:hypothetical protein